MELLFEHGRVNLTVSVRNQVPRLDQFLGHGFDAVAFLAQHVQTEARLRAALFLAEAPQGFHIGTVQAAQFGDGLEQVIYLGIQRAGLLRRLDHRHLVLSGHLVGQELPDPVHGALRHLLAHLHLDLGAALLGLCLQCLQPLATCVAQPLHVADAARLQVCRGVSRGLCVQQLVGGEFLHRHACLLCGCEQWQHAAPLLGQLDLLVGGQHAVERAAHLVGQLDVQRLQLLVDVQQPCAEALEQAVHLDVRSLALEQVGLEAARKLLVVAAALLEVQVVPLVQVTQAKPLHHGLHVAHDALLAIRQLLAGIHLRLKLVGHVQAHLQEEVAGFVQEGAQVGILEQVDAPVGGGEGSACSRALLVLKILGFLPTKE